MIQEEKIILREFFKFLKENNAFITYRINLSNNISRRNKNGFFNGIHTKIFTKRERYETLKFELINYAFTWSDTPQRHKYWSKLDNLWRRKLRNEIF
jgi:hypothetical protein